MLRHLPDPLHARILERRGGVEAASDGVADEGGAMFGEEGEAAAFVGDEGVDLGGFAVEVGGDGALFGEGRERGIK